MNKETYFNYVVAIQDNLELSVFPVLCPFPLTTDHVIANEAISSSPMNIAISPVPELDKLHGTSRILADVADDPLLTDEWYETFDNYSRRSSYKSLEAIFSALENWHGPCKMEFMHFQDGHWVKREGYGYYAHLTEKYHSSQGPKIYAIQLIDERDELPEYAVGTHLEA